MYVLASLIVLSDQSSPGNKEAKFHKSESNIFPKSLNTLIFQNPSHSILYTNKAVPKKLERVTGAESDHKQGG